MIEQDVINYLKSDVPLFDLMSAYADDSRIYPAYERKRTEYLLTETDGFLLTEDGERLVLESEKPYIIYNVISEGGLEENLNEISMSFNCASVNYTLASDIRNRIAKILDRRDEIQKLIDSELYRILWSKKVGGAEFKDSDIKTFYRAAIYDFKYVRREFLLTEDGEYLLTEDGERILI